MDVFAHALWTQAVFHKYRWKWWAVLLSFLVDAVVFGPIMLVILLQGGAFHGPPAIHGGFAASWAYLYNFTHSLVVWLVVAALLTLILRRFWWPLLGVFLHILIDIPTHSQAYFPTPFLWPLTSWTFSGISWAAPWFMALNYGSIALVYLLIYRKAILGRTKGLFHRAA